MPQQTVPVRFELSVNGEKIGTGGVSDSAVSLFIAHLARIPTEVHADHLQNQNPNYDEWLDETIAVSFSTLHSKWGQAYWVKDRPLRVGDAIGIRVLGPGPIDEPTENPKAPRRIEPEPEWDDPEPLECAEQRYYAALDAMIANSQSEIAEFRTSRAAFVRAYIGFSRTLSAAANRSGLAEWARHEARYRRLQNGVATALAAFEGCRIRRYFRLLPHREAASDGADSSVPVRFQVHVNGRHLATGGLKHAGPRILIMRTAYGAEDIPDHLKDDPNFDRDEWLREKTVLHFGGTGTANGRRELQVWIENAPVRVGDEVVVRVLGPGPSDEPVKRTPRSRPKDADPTDYDRAVWRKSTVYNERFEALIAKIAATDAEFRQQTDLLMQAGQDYIAALAEAAKHDGPNQETYRARSEYLPDALPAVISILEDFRAWKLRNSPARE
jgi:hypothetical protein